MLGVPVGKLSLSQFWTALIGYNVKARLRTEIMVSNRVDVNRSYLIEMALKGGYDLLMIDSDVVIQTEIEQIKAYLDADFKDKTIGMVVAPTVAQSGMVLTDMPENTKNETWLTRNAGLGFVCIRNEVMQKLPVISQYNGLGSTINMRVVYATNTSEDIMLCHKLEEMNYKILVDSRIKVMHIQSENLTYPESWNGHGFNK